MSLDVSLRSRIGTFHLDVVFTAPPGITALFGPSGAGKTQTLRGIAGLMKPEAGRIVLNERAIFDSASRTNVPTRQRRIGYLFQHYALFPHLDVARNIGYGLHRLSGSERDERIAELLALVGLGGFERRRVRELSGGQQQRIALARALAPAPDLLLLDEPFSAVDALVRRQLRSQLRRVQEQTGIPMLLVTHDLSEVRELAASMVLLEAGKVLAVGTPQAVVASMGRERIATLLMAAGGVMTAPDETDETDDTHPA